jgi:hypothetical protein
MKPEYGLLHIKVMRSGHLQELFAWSLTVEIVNDVPTLFKDHRAPYS